MNDNDIREQIADAAIRWAKAKEAEASRDERKLQSTTLHRNTQDQSLADIRRLAGQLECLEVMASNPRLFQEAAEHVDAQLAPPSTKDSQALG